jgi:hypothetical protein
LRVSFTRLFIANRANHSSGLFLPNAPIWKQRKLDSLRYSRRSASGKMKAARSSLRAGGDYGKTRADCVAIICFR